MSVQDNYISTFQKSFESLKNKGAFGLGLVEKAFKFAEEKHSGQFRKSGLPYIAHPVEVMVILEKLDFSADVLAAALLHDVVEDCNVCVKEIEKEFNPVVAKIVDAVTAIKPNHSLENMQAEIKTYQKLVSMGKINLFAFYIKFADRLHNLQTLSVFPKYKQVEKIKQTERFIVPLAKILKAKEFYRQITNQSFLTLQNNDDLNSFLKLYKNNVKNCNSFNKNLLSQLNIAVNKFIVKNKLKNSLTQIVISPLTQLEIKQELEKIMPLKNVKTVKKHFFSLIPTFQLSFVFENKTNLNNLIFELVQDKAFLKILTLANYGVEAFNQKDYFVFKSNYRVKFQTFFFSQKSYILHRNGSLDGSILHMIEEDFEDEIISDYITVKTRSDEIILMPNGSTVLDFAFKIHNDFGFSCKHAHLNNSPQKTPLFTKLSDGDKVNLIIAHDENNNTKNIAKLKWLTYVNNQKSKKLLLKYFENLYEWFF